MTHANKENFYSFVVPAHNEEAYIKHILESFNNLNYPRENFEVIVVENGSTDNTLAEANSYAKEGIRVMAAPKRGVSHARNLGARHASPKSTWLIFLDADSAVKPNFLHELDKFLQKNPSDFFVGGTALINPVEKTIAARFWFWIINLSRRFTKYPWTMQILRADLFGMVTYEESLNYGEDIVFTRAISKLGRQFLLRTSQVETSARRFIKMGWISVLLSWLFVWLLPTKYKKRKNYNVVR